MSQLRSGRYSFEYFQIKMYVQILEIQWQHQVFQIPFFYGDKGAINNISSLINKQRMIGIGGWG